MSQVRLAVSLFQPRNKIPHTITHFTPAIRGQIGDFNQADIVRFADGVGIGWIHGAAG